LARGIGLGRSVDRLWVVWGEPDDGTRRVIGQLWREPSGFAFAYVHGRDMDRAKQKGFRPLAEFPEERDFSSPYRSSYLFVTFAQRIPSPKRRDFHQIMESWGVDHTDNPLEVLSRSGGIQMTDRIELLEKRSASDDLEEPLYIRIAGMKKHPGSEHILVGDLLALKREPTNEHDENATMIVANGEKAGYVPRPYGALVARLLDGGVCLEARAVRQLGDPADVGRWVVRVARR
jgi:HIRAN domain